MLLKWGASLLAAVGPRCWAADLELETEAADLTIH